MSYSPLYNLDSALYYDIWLDGDLFRSKVRSIEVESVILDLELEGLEIDEEFWDQENMRVEIFSRDTCEDDSWL